MGNFIEPEQSQFKTIYVDITHRCQMNCSNCYLPNRLVPDMNLDSLYSCIKRLPKKTDLRLIGGEPTLREDLPEIIGRIIALGHRPILITNGLKLSSKSYTETLYRAGLRYAQLSMNGYKYDHIYLQTDQMKCADQKMRALANCEDIGISSSLSCILIRNVNTHLLPEMIDFAKTLKKPARLNFRNVGPVGRNMGQQHAPLTMAEMLSLLSAKIGLPAAESLKYRLAANQVRIPIVQGARRSQQILVKITDWTIFAEETVPDPKEYERGRITEDFRIAPSFQHIKNNEFGY